MTVNEYLHSVTCQVSLEDLWPAHLEKMAEYGFGRLLYGYTMFKTKTSLGDPDDFVVLSNHPREYLQAFFSTGMYHNAPLMEWALNNEGARSWASVLDRENSGQLSETEQNVLSFNRKMGLTAGYTISFNSSSTRFKGAISLAAKEGVSQQEVDEIWQEFGDEITLINNVVHLKIMTLPFQAPNRNLTRRQREVLQWVGDGKTTQDIALLLGLTVATIEKHLRLARESLSVETTAQAVLKAALHNQMYTADYHT